MRGSVCFLILILTLYHYHYHDHYHHPYGGGVRVCTHTSRGALILIRIPIPIDIALEGDTPRGVEHVVSQSRERDRAILCPEEKSTVQPLLIPQVTKQSRKRSYIHII